MNPKKCSCYGLKKIHTRNLLTKKNSCGSKIPLPPPHNFSNGPSLQLFCFFEVLFLTHKACRYQAIVIQRLCLRLIIRNFKLVIYEQSIISWRALSTDKRRKDQEASIYGKNLRNSLRLKAVYTSSQQELDGDEILLKCFILQKF